MTAKRVRAAVEAHRFQTSRLASSGGAQASGATASDEQQRTLRVTISLGLAAFPDNARDPIELVEMADTALYRAKHTGRNRVEAYCVASPAGAPTASRDEAR